MKTIPELREAVLKLDEQRGRMPRDVTTIRIDVRNLEQMHLEGLLEGFSVSVDEPPQRGGTNAGPSPLHYFLLGAASCFLTQMARVAIIKEMKIDSMEITARAHADRAKSRRFIDMIYDIRATGTETKDKTIELLHQAEEMCFVHNTLKSVIPMTSNLSLNGTQIATHTLGPGNA
ncbi:MAG: OsmC-related (seleno)protein [Nitrososphaerales archaeon]